MWSEDMLRFMRDACEYTRYYDELAAVIAPALPPRAHVCDAGCGAGYLALALLPYAQKVTAIDVSAGAIELLRAKGSAVEALVGNVHELPPQTPYDAMVCCFFGGTAEALSLGRAQCRKGGRLILIKKDWLNRRFTTDEEPVERHSRAETERELTAMGIPYTCALMSLEMGQPFRSWEDVLLFFRAYNFSGGEIDEEKIRARLTADPTGAYAYYMPARKDVAMFVIDL